MPDDVTMPLRAFKDEKMTLDHVRLLATVLRSNRFQGHPPVKTLSTKTGMPLDRAQKLLDELLLWDYIEMSE